MAVGSPRIRQQMLVAHQNLILRPGFRVHLHRQPLDGHLPWHYSPSLTCVTSPLPRVFLQTLPQPSQSCLLSCDFSTGFHHLPSSSPYLLWSFKLQLQQHPMELLSRTISETPNSPGPVVSVCLCTYAAGGSHGSEQEEHESVTPVP